MRNYDILSTIGLVIILILFFFVLYFFFTSPSEKISEEKSSNFFLEYIPLSLFVGLVLNYCYYGYKRFSIGDEYKDYTIDGKKQFEIDSNFLIKIFLNPSFSIMINFWSNSFHKNLLVNIFSFLVLYFLYHNNFFFIGSYLPTYSFKIFGGLIFILIYGYKIYNYFFP